MKTIGWCDMREIENYPEYFINKSGNVYSSKSDKYLKPIKKNTGYLYVFLYNYNGMKKHYIHLLVLNAFKGKKTNGHESRHLDGNNQNNCVDNLEWGTKQDNANDKRMHGTMPIPHESKFTKLKPGDIPLIRELYKKDYSYCKIGKLFGTSHTTIRKIICGQRWREY